jgi:hypothetical protein
MKKVMMIGLLVGSIVSINAMDKDPIMLPHGYALYLRMAMEQQKNEQGQGGQLSRSQEMRRTDDEDVRRGGSAMAPAKKQTLDWDRCP